MPGAPPRASTASPESSASAGRPEARAAWRALRMAFSTKLRPVSSASSLMNWLCGSTSICAPSMACSSLSLPALLLASTSWLKADCALLIRVKLLLETHGTHRRTVIRLYLDFKLQQAALARRVIGDEVDGVLFLHANELQWGSLLNQVFNSALHFGIHYLYPVIGQALHGNVHHALARTALQAGSGGNVRLQVGAVEGVVVHQQVAKTLRALGWPGLGGGEGSGEHQQAGEQNGFHGDLLVSG